jgi:hypothetical protein
MRIYVLTLVIVFVLVSCWKSDKEATYNGDITKDPNVENIWKNYFSKGDYIYSKRYWWWNLVEWADFDSFIELKDLSFEWSKSGYWKDNNSVFFRWTKLEWADPTTFIVMWDMYWKDNKSVYYQEVKLWIADVWSFVVLSPSQMKDKSVYNYWKDSNNVFYSGKQIVWAVSRSFEQLSTLFARDSQNVYFSGEKLDAADPWTIEVFNLTYAKDKNNVFNYEWVIEWIHATSFKRYNDSDYFGDKNGVYFTRELFVKVEGADAATFIALGNWYAKDRNNIYHQESILNNFDLESFQLLTYTQWWINDRKPIYLKDKNNVYLSAFFEKGAELISLADSESFEILKDWYYAKDRNNIYWYSRANTQKCVLFLNKYWL